MSHGVRFARLRGAAVASIAVLAASCLSVPVADAAVLEPARPGAPPKPGGVALTWAPTYMADRHEYTRARAKAIAAAQDLVAAVPESFANHVRAMRRVNPDLTLVAYVNGTLIKASKVSHLPETAFAHDSQGRRITSQIWGTTLMAPTSPAWRRFVDALCRARKSAGGYDGCVMDSMGLGIFAANQQFTGIPVDPDTGEQYRQAAYRKDLAGLANYLRAASPRLVHVFNVVENDWRYWVAEVRSRPLALGRPAVQMEDFLRGAGSSVSAFPDTEKWRRNVEVVRDLEEHNVTGLFTTKLWVSHNYAQAAQWQAFAMASFLMGANGNSYFAFTRSRDKAGATGANAPYSMPNRLGRPLGAMNRTSAGFFIRRFRNGMAIVNPGTTTVTVNLASAMRRLNGATVTSVQLPPSSGEVLVR